MLTMIVGPPGTGKTCKVVQDYILPAIKEGRHVYHNIPGLDDTKAFRIAMHLRLDSFAVEGLLHYMPCDTEDEIIAFLKFMPTLPERSLIVMDEAQNLIGSRDWQSPRNKDFFEYATKHRHHKHDIVVVTQHEDNVDGTIRRIANGLIVLRRLEAIGWLFRNSVSCRFYDSFQNRNVQPLSKRYMKYNKATFTFYDSYDGKAKGGAAETRRVDSIWFNWKIIAMFVVFVACMSRIPAFMRQFGMGPKPVPPMEQPKPKSPLDYLGDYEDYFCGTDGFYVLRSGGRVDTLRPSSIPAGVCPRINYSPGGSKK